MKNLELENYGVQEMNANEMQNIDGGSFILLALVAGLIVGYGIGEKIFNHTK